jgi:general secretion pathway protein A
MERVWAAWRDERDFSNDAPGNEFVLESRAKGLATLRSALESQKGPALLTGEAGVGKTWLWHRLRDELPKDWHWLGVDLSPANDPADLYRLIGHAAGLDRAEVLSAARLSVADFLEDSAADGRTWVLVADEAHTVSMAVLEELRILANRLGRSDGFAGVLIVGQTGLARRLAINPLSSLSARISARVHLRSLDIEEARTLVDRLVAQFECDSLSFEELHRDTLGIPKRLLRIAGEISRPTSARSRKASTLPPVLEPAYPEPAPPAWDPPVLGPSKAPLRVEDGLIEVGWDPEPSPPPIPSTGTSLRKEPARVSDSDDEDEELIEDHYAALQAWNEWAQNQGRVASPVIVAAPGEASAQFRSGDNGQLSASGAASGSTGLRAETQHTFAPYSQLFSRLKNHEDSN